MILPMFGIKEDSALVKQFEELYKEIHIVTLESNDIAKDGGC